MNIKEINSKIEECKKKANETKINMIKREYYTKMSKEICLDIQNHLKKEDQEFNFKLEKELFSYICGT